MDVLFPIIDFEKNRVWHLKETDGRLVKKVALGWKKTTKQMHFC